MTGLVKEEILTRMVELGIYIHNGQLIFDLFLLGSMVAAPFLFLMDVFHTPIV